MMVEKAPSIDLDLLLKATTKLNEIAGKKQAVSRQDLNELHNVLRQFNTQLDPRIWESKKIAPEEMSGTVEKALNALDLFKRNKNVEQAIASLYASMISDLNAFDKNLRDLKDLKLGKKVEKSSESRPT